MVEVDAGKILFIDRLTQKRIENWCDKSDEALRNMAEQIKSERPDTQYVLQDSGVYVLKY